MADYAALYREARERVCDLVRDLPRAELDRTVPSCPRWSVHGTVSHLAAGAADAVSGRLTGMPTEDQTDEQVRARRDLPVPDVLAEWSTASRDVEQAFAARRMSSAMLHDLLTHEADLRGALGAGRPPAAAWTVSLLALGKLDWLDVPGSLTVLAGEHRFGSGAGEPAVTLEVDPYEFWRALFGRRSRAQLAGWHWSGDPAQHVTALPVFGPTERDLSEPV